MKIVKEKEIKKVSIKKMTLEEIEKYQEAIVNSEHQRRYQKHIVNRPRSIYEGENGIMTIKGDTLSNAIKEYLANENISKKNIENKGTQIVNNEGVEILADHRLDKMDALADMAYEAQQQGEAKRAKILEEGKPKVEETKSK